MFQIPELMQHLSLDSLSIDHVYDNPLGTGIRPSCPISKIQPCQPPAPQPIPGLLGEILVHPSGEQPTRIGSDQRYPSALQCIFPFVGHAANLFRHKECRGVLGRYMGGSTPTPPQEPKNERRSLAKLKRKKAEVGNIICSLQKGQN